MQQEQPPPRATINSSLPARARRHFEAVARVVAALRSARDDVRWDMRQLAGEFRAAMAPCRLVLYVKKGRDGSPRALYWGHTFKLETVEGTRRLRKHLPGRLTGRMIYRIALRWTERERFFAFDAKRRELNGKHRRLARALGRIAQMLALIRVPPSRAPALPSPDPALEGAWRLSWACAAVEQDMIGLARRRDPAVGCSPIFPYATTTKHGYVAMGWAFPERFVRGCRLRSGRRHVAAKLTGEIMERLGIACSFRPGLRAIDRAMRKLRLEHARYARVLGRIRRMARPEPRKESVNAA